ncbi:hypothetical protein O3M35_006673 [Rhynocoris fuscipes]|uniref:Uncharacterized protein n=1 Tax=Rhynocoris fuscipes TaxID=488301 RepID=A0AAW1DFQ6_9HEMI
MFPSEQDNPNLYIAIKVFAVIGFIYVLKLLLFFLINSWIGFKTYILPKLCKKEDLVKKYGPWAVITGSTDGIGKEFAMEYAKRGLNICLISRSISKLQDTANQIVNKYGVNTKFIQADFSRTDVYDNIRKELSDLDIGILVNNVGIAMETPEPFLHENEDFYWRILNVNIAAAVMMTSIVLPGMVARNRGLIVNMGSQTGIIPVPYMSVYSSSKAFINMFSTCLELELENKNIRVQCLLGGWIHTKLMDKYTGVVKLYRRYFPWVLPTAARYAASAVSTISSGNNYTSGYWGHALFLAITEFTTGRYLQARIAKAVVKPK